MPFMINDYVESVPKTCEFCGKPLKTVEIECLGRKTHAPCYASCGCEQSRAKMDSVATASLTRKQRYEYAGIPAKWTDKQFAQRDLIDCILDKRNAYLTGGNGAGKSAAAAWAAAKVVNLGSKVLFISSTTLLSDLRKGFDTGNFSSFDKARSVDVLVLDDLGKEHVTSYSLSIIFDLIDYRYKNGRQIIITSNYSRGELCSKYASVDPSTAQAIVSRLSENTTLFEFKGHDRRLQKVG